MKALLACFGFLIGCSTILLAGGEDGLSKEPIVLEDLQRNLIVFKAKSHGCSTDKDFRVVYEGRDISIDRIKPDRCRRMPFWQVFSLPLSLDVRETEVYLLNPLVLQAD